MKRQRTNDCGEDSQAEITYSQILKFFRQTPVLDSEQLFTLGKEIDRLCSQHLNSLTQNFPSELWLQMLQNAENPGLKSFLAYRTVSKSWHSVISTKFDFSRWFAKAKALWRTGFDAQKLLSRFKVTHARLETLFKISDISILKNLKGLHIHRHLLGPQQVHLLSQLTQLTELGIHGSLQDPPDWPINSFLHLTNLQTLLIKNSPEITSITTLTNLHTLKLKGRFGLTQESLREMTNLTRLESSEYRFFESGRGRWKCWNGAYYDGDWIKGDRNGEGFMKYGDSDTTYEGSWLNDVRHGKGSSPPFFFFVSRPLSPPSFFVLVFGFNEFLGVLRCSNPKKQRYTTYTGNFEENNRSGHGIKVYHNQDTYDGSWLENYKHGQGVYTFHEKGGTSYVGEFVEGALRGTGRYVYQNGDVYEGQWEEGKRHGKGVYTIAENGKKIEGDWWHNFYGPLGQDQTWLWEGSKICWDELSLASSAISGTSSTSDSSEE